MSADNIYLDFFGAKGGVGTSTLAAISAAALRRAGESVSIEGSDDLSSILDGWVNDPHPSIIVSDNRGEPHHECCDDTHISVLVVRNDYLSLKRALHTAREYNYVACITEPNRALAIGDVASALGVAHRDLMEIPLSPAVARSVDAGVIPHLPPQSTVQDLQPVLDRALAGCI